MIYLNFIKYDNNTFTKILYTFYGKENSFNYINSKFKYKKIYSIETLDLIKEWIIKNKFFKNNWYGNYFKISKIEFFQFMRKIEFNLSILKTNYRNGKEDKCLSLFFEQFNVTFPLLSICNNEERALLIVKDKFKVLSKIYENIVNLKETLLYILNDVDFSKETVLFEITKSENSFM